MNKIIYTLFLSVLSVNIAIGQMSNSQIIEYLKIESAKGVSQENIARELVKRGVTQQQLLELSSMYSSNNSQTQVSAEQTRVGNGNELRNQFDFSEYRDSLSFLIPAQKYIFGHNIFQNRNLTFTPEINVPTPIGYRLGPGDEVVIEIWGTEADVSERHTISTEGSIRIQRLGPIYLNGMTVEEANKYIQQRFTELYSGIRNDGSSQIKLTLGQIRSIQVNVMGEVTTPGTYTVSSLASVFHALYNAGGTNDIGSLRSVHIYRNSKQVATVDIYDYLLRGETSGNIRLQDGDIIIVPAYISLINVTGKVKRPMHYEMKRDEALLDLLSYAGGFTGDAYRESVTIFRKSGGKESVLTIMQSDFDKSPISDGDSIVVRSGLNLYENRVEIQGAIHRPGYYGLESIKTIRELIDAAEGVMGDAFMERALLTREKEDLTFESISVDLRKLLSGEEADIALRNNDILFIATNEILQDLGPLTIYGDVLNPGPYDYAENTTIEDLIIKAGGLLSSASMSKVDVARRKIDHYSTQSPTQISETYTFEIIDGLIITGDRSFTLQPYDNVYIRRSPSYTEQRNVILNGEILFPGTYALQVKNERISEVIKRAGGLTNSAFQQGARLTRMRTEDEIVRLKAGIDIIDKSDPSDSISLTTVTIDTFYVVGIELEMALSNPGSMYDIVLKDGDILSVPELDNTVRITGAVMYPNTVLYKRGEKLKHYINQGGGYSTHAKKSKAYVVYMNGTVSKIRRGDYSAIQPGCEIIVPSKEQRDKLTTAETISIGSNLASMISMIAVLINVLR